MPCNLNAGLYSAADIDCVHIRGGPRDTLGVALPRTPFLETVAALRGVEPEEVTAADRLLTPMRQPLQARCVGGSSGSSNRASNRRYPVLRRKWPHEVFASMADSYLAARPATSPKGQVIRQRGRIVRKAEEQFMAADGRPVSLADLRAAAGVRKCTLYPPFGRVRGQPPLRHFHKGRLTRARLQLMESSPRRGAVKRVALGLGFTELGRFASEHRHLFRELPFATLSSPPS